MTKHHAPKQHASQSAKASTASPFGPQSLHFQQAQDELRSETQTFWAAWLQRRQDAMKEGMEAASQIAQLGGRDPAAALKMMTDWQGREMARLTEDASDTTAMMTRGIGGLLTHEVEAAEELAEATKSATSSHHALPL